MINHHSVIASILTLLTFYGIILHLGLQIQQPFRAAIEYRINPYQIEK